MSKRWDAGVFLAMAKELSRRLRNWHINDFLSPVQTVSQRESRSWVRRTFREILPTTVTDPDARPGEMQVWMNEGGRADDDGCVGEACPNPARDTDRSLTQQLMRDFLCHLDAAPPLPAISYLKESFGQILGLPAWTVVAPPAALRSGGDERGLMVTGRQVPPEFLDTLTGAAEKLLAAAPADWASPGGPLPPTLPTDAPAWLRRLRSLRSEFERFAVMDPRLRHQVISAITPRMHLPDRMAAHMAAEGNEIRKCDCWAWDGECPEVAFLYGPPAEVTAFTFLAEQAWLAVPMGEDRELTGHGPSEHWLRFVYAVLRQEFPTYFNQHRVLRVVGSSRTEDAIYTFNPGQEADADDPHWAGRPRFRHTSLRVDPFSASVAVIDAITSEDFIQTVLDRERRWVHEMIAQNSPGAQLRRALDAGERAALELLKAVGRLKGIARQGVNLPAGDSRQPVVLGLTNWLRDVPPRIETLQPSLVEVRDAIIEARGGQSCEFKWRVEASALDLLVGLERRVTPYLRQEKFAVEGGSRILCDRLETLYLDVDLEWLRVELIKEFAQARQRARQATTADPATTAPAPRTAPPSRADQPFGSPGSILAIHTGRSCGQQFEPITAAEGGRQPKGGVTPMNEYFDPYRSAAFHCASLSSKAVFEHALQREAADREARDQLQELTRLVTRRLKLGLPPIRDGYPEGRTAWEIDIGQALSDLCQFAGEVVEAATSSPAPPEFDPLGRNSDQVQQHAEAQNRSVQQLQAAESRMKRVCERIWSLGQWVDFPTPPDPPAAPQPHPQDGTAGNENEPDGQRNQPPTRRQDPKGKLINEKMIKKLLEDGTRIDWSVRDWAESLDCSISTVQATEAWERIKAARALREAENATRQKRSRKSD